MKKNARQYLIGGFCLMIAALVFLLYNQTSPSVEAVQDTLTYQQTIDSKLSETIQAGSYTWEKPYVQLNPYGNAPLSALIAFTTEDEVAVTVTIPGKDEKTSFTHEFESKTSHLIPVYGLYADTLNNIILTLSDGRTQTVDIQTEPLPKDFKQATSVYADKQKLNNDLYFTTPAATGYTAAYDINGDVRWYLTTINAWDIKRLENGNLLLSSDRLVSLPYYATGLMEMDLLGKVYIEYVLEESYHHDAVELPNGNFLMAANNPNKMTVEDYVVELDRQTGKVVKSWDLTTILPTDVAKSQDWMEVDWFHNNSVEFDEINQSIILSGRHQDAVISIDYHSGKLNWIVGDSTGWPEEMQSYFFTPIGENFEWQWSQHSPKMLPDGKLSLFDNGNNRSKNPDTYVNPNDNYSRGVIYELDTNAMTIKQVFEFGKERGSSFYSPYISGFSNLGPDHHLIHSGGIVSVNGQATNRIGVVYVNDENATLSSQTVEVLEGERIFELHLPANFYRVSKLSLYPDTDNYTLTPGKRLGTLGETKTVALKVDGLRFNKNELSSDYKIKLTQESDRLILTGNFKKEQKVNFILNKLGEQRVYNVPIINIPYKTAFTARGTDLVQPEVTDNERLTITKYVNAEGLLGTYELYLEIDGVVYPLHQSATFNK